MFAMNRTLRFSFSILKKSCFCSKSIFPSSQLFNSIHTHTDVQRSFLIPKSYRAKSFSISPDQKDENDEPTKHFVSQDLKIEKYIATDEKTHQNYIEVESEIAARQQELHRLYKEQKYDEALKLAEETLVLIGDHFGDNHPVYACGLNDVALMCKSMGDLERASTLYQKAIKIYDYTCGKNHASTLKTMMNLAILYKTAGDLNDGMERLQCYMKADELKKEIEDRKSL